VFRSTIHADFRPATQGQAFPRSTEGLTFQPWLPQRIIFTKLLMMQPELPEAFLDYYNELH
jgi:hypothetical protein